MKALTVFCGGFLCIGAAWAQARPATMASVSPSPADRMECTACHGPGDSSREAVAQPAAGRFFVLYDSLTLDNKPAPLFDPADGTLGAKDPLFASLVCMGCHDGGIASARGPRFTSPVSSAPCSPGYSLFDDHPINLSHNPANDPGLHSVATVTAAGIKLYGPNQTVQCASCHDPHQHTRDGLPAPEKLLRVTQFQSRLCLSCHQ